jgi:tRNA (mo5U34)-methyltransferase
VTPGDYDLPDAARRIPFPASLEGKRCLDVGTRDGFWAFEMEKRGASEVIAIDLDDPADLDFPAPRPPLSSDIRTSLDVRASAFGIAHHALGSQVDRRNLSVYDLAPEQVGTFDFAFIGTLLLHLRNPVDALSAVRGVLAPNGRLMSNDAVSLTLSVLWPKRGMSHVRMQSPWPFWYLPNITGHRRFITAAGFEIESAGGPYLMRYGAGFSGPPRDRSIDALVLRRGVPHGWAIARPGATSSS